MKMLMNEYRLNLGTAEAQEFLINRWTITSLAKAPRFRRITFRPRKSDDPERLMANTQGLME